MFINRPDVVEQFASNFRDTVDGEIIFQPKNAEIGLPITWEEYDSVLAAFERRLKINMVLTWAVTLGAAGYGGYKVMAEGSYMTFFIALGMAFIWSAALHMRDGLGLLLPFIQRRDELQKAMEAQAQIVA